MFISGIHRNFSGQGRRKEFRYKNHPSTLLKSILNFVLYFPELVRFRRLNSRVNWEQDDFGVRKTILCYEALHLSLVFTMELLIRLISELLFGKKRDSIHRRLTDVHRISGSDGMMDAIVVILILLGC